MSPAAELLHELRRLGVTVRAEGDTLRFRPRGVVPDDLRDRLRRHKADLLTLLTEPTAAPVDFTAALSLCLICGWWGPRHDFPAHKETAEHLRAVAQENQR